MALEDVLYSSTASSLGSSVFEWSTVEYNTSGLEGNLTVWDNVTTVIKRLDGREPHRAFAPYYPFLVLALGLSVIGLLATAWVYIYLREYRNVPGKVVLTMSGCLLVTYLFLAVDMGARRYLIGRPACAVVGALIHTTFLALFFWTNVLTWDLWRNLTRLRAAPSPGRSYFKYSVYAWSGSILTALPALILDHVPAINPAWQPHFGYKRCWLSGTSAFLVYFNLPVGLLLLCNAAMFILTALALARANKEAAILDKGKQRQRFHLYLKLFFLMGFTWVTEYVPWLSGIYELYLLAGLLTCLHGVFILVIFVCKPATLRQLRRAWENGRDAPPPPNTSKSRGNTTATSI